MRPLRAPADGLLGLPRPQGDSGFRGDFGMGALVACVCGPRLTSFPLGGHWGLRVPDDHLGVGSDAAQA